MYTSIQKANVIGDQTLKVTKFNYIICIFAAIIQTLLINSDQWVVGHQAHATVQQADEEACRAPPQEHSDPHCQAAK